MPRYTFEYKFGWLYPYLVMAINSEITMKPFKHCKVLTFLSFMESEFLSEQYNLHVIQSFSNLKSGLHADHTISLQSGFSPQAQLVPLFIWAFTACIFYFSSYLDAISRITVDASSILKIIRHPSESWLGGLFSRISATLEIRQALLGIWVRSYIRFELDLNSIDGNFQYLHLKSDLMVAPALERKYSADTV